MENMEIYNALRTPPETAKKQIGGGRLKGMTDINPMWRIKALTERFGPCGFGWVYTIVDKHLEPGANGEIAAFVDIELYVKDGETWSKPIPGTGGAAFIANEQKGAYTSDECYKMALTDALSVACKALGMAADVYWDKDRTKYDQPHDAIPSRNTIQPPGPKCSHCGNEIMPYNDGKKAYTAQQMADRSTQMFGVPLCAKCSKAEGKLRADQGYPPREAG